MVFRNLSCLGIIICYINIIGIIPAYACNVLNVCDAFVQILQPLANVHETKWTRHVKRDCDVAVIIAVVSLITRCLNLPHVTSQCNVARDCVRYAPFCFCCDSRGRKWGPQHHRFITGPPNPPTKRQNGGLLSYIARWYISSAHSHTDTHTSHSHRHSHRHSGSERSWDMTHDMRRVMTPRTKSMTMWRHDRSVPDVIAYRYESIDDHYPLI